MITLHRLNGEAFCVNPDLIEFMETIPDTVVTLQSGNKFIVRESPEIVSGLILTFRRAIVQEVHS